MFESMTYDSILQRMLNAVSLMNPNVDTREGSIIYNALAPAAVELQVMYVQLDAILDETFADTASRDYLVLRAGERGLSPYPATYAVVQGNFNIDVPIGSRFSLINEYLNYTVISQISPGVFQLQCETLGSGGNQTGQLVPIDYISGLETAQITGILIPGEDVEETETFRRRYFKSFNTEAFGGNISDYKEKTDALPGVGGVKVYPVWNGGGTVKLVIIASDYTAPSSELISQVQTAVDPVQNSGTGLGIAPIGHVVTVQGVTSMPVSVTMQLTYQEGWNWESVQPYVMEAVDNYFLELAETWADEGGLIVRISQIETRMLDLAGILDISGTMLNGEESNLQLEADQIPVRGDVWSDG